METIIIEIYNALPKKFKQNLYEDYGIDSAYDLEKHLLDNIQYNHQ